MNSRLDRAIRETRRCVTETLVAYRRGYRLYVRRNPSGIGPGLIWYVRDAASGARLGRVAASAPGASNSFSAQLLLYRIAGRVKAR